MLAGDAGAVIADSTAISADVAISVPETPRPDAQLQSQTVVFLDSEIEQADVLLEGLVGADLVMLTPGENPIEQITEVLRSRRDVRSIHIISHGDSGRLRLAGQLLDAEKLLDGEQTVRSWSQSLHADADILIYGCNVGAGDTGTAFMQTLAKLTGADVAASVDRTGSAAQDGDWELEKTVGRIESRLALKAAALARYSHVMPITIQAAGETGQEQMSLQIDGETVATFENVGGDIFGGDFVEYTFDGGEGVTGDRITITFDNDLYDPGLIDRNLRVDSITLDNGLTLQTEDPEVFASGTWVPGAGITSGNLQTEWLHSDGFFQYYDPAGTGSQVRILAAGSTGQEQMSLLVDGQVVATYENVGGDPDVREFESFTYSSTETLTPERVSVRFDNDFYDPDNGIDYNLRVDAISIDSVRYESEAPETTSTGGVPGAPPTPSEWLFVEGAFQYGSESPGGPQNTIALETSLIDVNEDSGQAIVRLVRTGDLSGTASIEYRTFDQTAIAGEDYEATSGTAFFAQDQDSFDIVIPIFTDETDESPETFTITIDNTIRADLGVPRTATVEIFDGEPVSGVVFDYQGFAGTGGSITTNVGASIDGDALQVTSAAQFQRGSAFNNAPISLANDASFQTNFSFEINGGSGPGGADGLVFLLQSTGPSAIGQGGSGLGYGGLGGSLAVEFDTWQNGWDAFNDEVSIHLNGDRVNAVSAAQAPLNLNSGDVVYAWIDFNGQSNTLSVYLSADSAKPQNAVLSTNVNLPGVVGAEAYVGFTASNFDRPNAHRVLSWSLSGEQPVDPPPSSGGEVVSQFFAGGFVQPTAIDWSPDGRNAYVSQKGGEVYVIRDGVRLSTPVVDISAQVNNTNDRGLLDVAVHPDLVNNPYLYLLYTYDPPEVFQYTGNNNAGPDGQGNRVGRLTRVTLDASTDYTTAIPGSETVLLGAAGTWDSFNGFVQSAFDINIPPAGENPDGSYVRDFINSDSTTHTIGSIDFAPDGSLFVSVGDGASFNRVDPRATRVQDIDSLSGKILRIDPISGDGLASNPFYDGDPGSNRSKVYQLGLRNPFRISVDDATGRLYIGDVGWTTWEEVNTGAPGANFGWPYYEGGSGVNVPTGGYSNLPEAQAFYDAGGQATPATLALNHNTDGINAIMLGEFIRDGNLGDEYEGDILYGDLGQGVIYVSDVDSSGQLFNQRVFATGLPYVVDMRQAPDGTLYYVNLVTGEVNQWVLA